MQTIEPGASTTPTTYTTATAPLPHHSCPLCGGANLCAPAQANSFEVDCWCQTAPVSLEARQRASQMSDGRTCLCPRCAAPVANG